MKQLFHFSLTSGWELKKYVSWIYELDPDRFLTASGPAWQAALEKTNLKLDLLTDIDTLLMVEKGIMGGKCHAIYRYIKANNKCYDKKT